MSIHPRYVPTNHRNNFMQIHLGNLMGLLLWNNVFVHCEDVLLSLA